MPVKASTRQKVYRERNLEKVRKRDRDRKKKARVKKAKTPSSKAFPASPSKAIAKWAREKLVVPPGHPLEGKPLVIPDFGLRFLEDVFCHSEASLIVARKNAKSAIVAVLLLAHLIGPLRKKGFRAGCVSLTREKAGELKRQAEAIVLASKLEGVRFMRTAAPSIVSDYGTVDILASGTDAGAASGFDLSIVDEIGLLKERDRGLVNSMRSSVSAKAGRFISLSVYGSGPFVPEILARKGDPSLAVHLYQSDPDLPLDDEKNWHLSNPGLVCGIKSLDYMKAESRRVLVTVSDQASFQSLDLNLQGHPSREMLCSTEDWKACEVEKLPPRTGSCFIGWDCGGALSMTALVALWPNGRLETFAAFGDTPGLMDRGAGDGVGGLYQEMKQRGELTTYAGRVVPVGEFLKDCAVRLKGQTIIQAGADRYRKSEALQAIEEAQLRWPIVWRGCGASAIADGSHDIRAFQKMIYAKATKARKSLLMRSAISESELSRRDGNPKLNKSRHHSRIDVLQAAVIAAGLLALSGGKVATRRVTILD